MPSANIPDGSIAEMNDVSLAAIGAAIGAFLTGLFAWLVQRTKGGTDIQVTAIGEWQKLYNALSTRLASVETEFAIYRTKMAEEMTDMRLKHAAEMKARDDQIAGLVRQLAQDSQSTARLLGHSPVTNAKDGGNGK